MYLSLFLQKYDINLLTGDDKKSKGGICIVNNKLIVVNGSMELVIIDNKNKEFLTSKKLNSRLLTKYLNNNIMPNKSAMTIQLEFKPINQINE